MTTSSPLSNAGKPAQAVALSRLLTQVAQGLQAIRGGQSGAAVLQAVPAALRRTSPRRDCLRFDSWLAARESAVFLSRSNPLTCLDNR